MQSWLVKTYSARIMKKGSRRSSTFIGPLSILNLFMKGALQDVQAGKRGSSRRSVVNRSFGEVVEAEVQKRRRVRCGNAGSKDEVGE